MHEQGSPVLIQKLNFCALYKCNTLNVNTLNWLDRFWYNAVNFTAMQQFTQSQLSVALIVPRRSAHLNAHLHTCNALHLGGATALAGVWWIGFQPEGSMLTMRPLSAAVLHLKPLSWFAFCTAFYAKHCSAVYPAPSCTWAHSTATGLFPLTTTSRPTKVCGRKTFHVVGNPATW